MTVGGDLTSRARSAIKATAFSSSTPADSSGRQTLELYFQAVFLKPMTKAEAI